MKALSYQGPRGVRVSPGVYSCFLHGLFCGHAFEKRLIFKMGQTQAQRYLAELLAPIGSGKMKPELIVSHRRKLDGAAPGCELSDEKKTPVTKSF